MGESIGMIQTWSVGGGCVGTDPITLLWVVPFVIADGLLIGDVISGVECVVLAIGGMVDVAKPLDNVTNGLACCDWVCEFWCVVWKKIDRIKILHIRTKCKRIRVGIEN